MRASDVVVVALATLAAGGCLGADHRLGSVSGGTGESEGAAGDDASGTDGLAESDDAPSGTSGADTGGGSADTGASAVDPFAGAEVVKPYVDGLAAATDGTWSPERVRLLVTDPGADMILAAQPMSFAPLYMPADGAVALVELGATSILVAEGTAGRLVRRDDDAVAVLREGLSSPRALARADNGDVYVVHGEAATAIGRLHVDGTWTDELDGLPPIEGLGWMPSGEALVAVVPGSGELLRAELDADGAPAAPVPFAEVAEATGAVCFDDHGNTIVGAGTGLSAFAADGTQWEGLDAGTPVLACSFGGFDGRTVYLVGATAIQTVRLAVTGQP